MKRIAYEWISRELVLDEYGDIVNICTDGHETFKEALEYALQKNDYLESDTIILQKYYLDGSGFNHVDLAIRTVYSDTYSSWCANALTISELFQDGSAVPKYLLKEIEKEVRTWGGDTWDE